MAEEHTLVTWLRTRLGYKPTLQGTSVALYPEDVAALTNTVDVYVLQCLDDMHRHNARLEDTLRSEIFDLQNKLISERSENVNLLIRVAALKQKLTQLGHPHE
jgi:hypothetical protein